MAPRPSKLGPDSRSDPAPISGEKMKHILLFVVFLFIISPNTIALVGEGEAQIVSVKRDKKGVLLFITDGKIFKDVDSCAKYCYKKSSFTDENSNWSNLVQIKIFIDLSKEKRQYIGDRFVANKVYPDKIKVYFQYTYKPDKKSLRKKEKTTNKGSSTDG